MVGDCVLLRHRAELSRCLTQQICMHLPALLQSSNAPQFSGNAQYWHDVVCGALVRCLQNKDNVMNSMTQLNVEAGYINYCYTQQCLDRTQVACPLFPVACRVFVGVCANVRARVANLAGHVGRRRRCEGWECVRCVCLLLPLSLYFCRCALILSLCWRSNLLRSRTAPRSWWTPGSSAPRTLPAPVAR